jgi:hypothetical protein
MTSKLVTPVILPEIDNLEVYFDKRISKNLNLQAGSQDILVNVISDTLVNHYEVIKEEIYSTGDKSYRAYILLRISKDNIDRIISDIQKKKIAEIKSEDLNKQAKELLNSKKN